MYFFFLFRYNHNYEWLAEDLFPWFGKDFLLVEYGKFFAYFSAIIKISYVRFFRDVMFCVVECWTIIPNWVIWRHSLWWLWSTMEKISLLISYINFSAEFKNAINIVSLTHHYLINLLHYVFLFSMHNPQVKSCSALEILSSKLGTAHGLCSLMFHY